MSEEFLTFIKRPHLYSTNYGAAYLGDSLEYLKDMKDNSVDLIMTSPPFALRRKNTAM